MSSNQSDRILVSDNSKNKALSMHKKHTCLQVFTCQYYVAVRKHFVLMLLSQKQL